LGTGILINEEAMGTEAGHMTLNEYALEPEYLSHLKTFYKQEYKFDRITYECVLSSNGFVLTFGYLVKKYNLNDIEVSYEKDKQREMLQLIIKVISNNNDLYENFKYLIMRTFGS